MAYSNTFSYKYSLFFFLFFLGHRKLPKKKKKSFQFTAKFPMSLFKPSGSINTQEIQQYC